MGQLYWPETAGLARYSIPSEASPSPPNILLQPTYQNNSIDDRLDPPTPKLIEIPEDHHELLYDGLISLNESRLDEMIETDLVSSSNG